jgi:hypothetical protein
MGWEVEEGQEIMGRRIRTSLSQSLRRDTLFYYSDVCLRFSDCLPIVWVCIRSRFGMCTLISNNYCAHFLDTCFSTRHTRYQVAHVSANGLGLAEVGRS